MLAEFFRKSGWEVFADPALSEQDIFNTIGEKDFHIVGISIGSYDQKESTKKLISDIRRMYGPALKIIIGGPLAFCENNLLRIFLIMSASSSGRSFLYYDTSGPRTQPCI